MTDLERVKAADRKKEEGNKLYKTGKYRQAVKRYCKVFICSFDLILILFDCGNHRSALADVKLIAFERRSSSRFYGKLKPGKQKTGRKGCSDYEMWGSINLHEVTKVNLV